MILHVDGDYFFAGCEIARRPDLRGKPVVVGKERGIITALTPEAKKLGVIRGMPIYQVRKIDKNIVILESNYNIYRIYSNRMNHIVSRYANMVEAYSIDECFADLGGMDIKLGKSFEDIATSLQKDLHTELGMTFSVGVAPTKVLAKIASKLKKPNGLTFIYEENRRQILSDTAISKIWGIGPKSSQSLYKQGIKTALDFTSLGLSEVESTCSKPHRDIWYELNGVSVNPVSNDHDDQASIMRSGSFGTPTNNQEMILSELSRNIEIACSTLWNQGRGTSRVYFFLKTQSFIYRRGEVELPRNTHSPDEIMAKVIPKAKELMSVGVLYRATGIILSDLHTLSYESDLFGNGGEYSKKEESYHVMQDVIKRFGEEVMMFGSSLLAYDRRSDNNAFSPYLLYKGRKYLPIPFLGEVN